MLNKDRKRLEGIRKAVKFTLIELLVVIAIIAILASMLMPALSRARTAAYCSGSLSNVRQLSMNMHIYAQDHDEYMPFYRHADEAGDADHMSGWPENLYNHGYLPSENGNFDGSSILWGPGRKVEPMSDRVNRLSERRISPGYGLNMGVTVCESVYDPSEQRHTLTRITDAWIPSVSEIIMLAEGYALPEDTYRKHYGTLRIEPEATGSTEAILDNKETGLYQYDGQVVRSYLDGHAQANIDDPSGYPGFGWDPTVNVDAMEDFTVEAMGPRSWYIMGPYSGIWTSPYINRYRYFAPWFTWKEEY